MTPKITLDEAEALKGNGLPLQTMREFLAEPDEVVAWVVDDLLPASGLSELVAKPKVGKSTLARCLAVAVARGTSFLGRAVHVGPVIYCAFEEKRSEVRRHFRQLGVSDEDPIHVLIGRTPVEFLPKLAESITLLRPVLVVVDPMIRLARVVDLSAYAEVALALEPVLNLARETGAHVVLVHHGRKMGGEGGDVTLGSTAIFGAVDVGMFLRKHDGHRYVVTEERYGRGFDTEFLLPFDPTTGWVTLGPSRREHAQHERSGAILDYLGTQSAPVVEADVVEHVEGQKTIVQGALRQLVKDGKVTRTGGGKKGDPYLYHHPDAHSPEVAKVEKAPEVAVQLEVTLPAQNTTSLPPAYIPGGREVESLAPKRRPRRRG